MSGNERQIVLKFSLGGTASQAILGLLMTGGCLWMAIDYGFYPDESSLRSELDGAPGLILCSILGLCFAFWTLRAGWRFFSDGNAAVLTECGVRFHPSCARDEISYGEISEVDIGRDLLSLRNIYVRRPGKWRIRLQSNEVEGGKEALMAFAEALNARRSLFRGKREAGLGRREP